MTLFHLKFMINGMILSLKYLISHILMEMFFAPFFLCLYFAARVRSNVSGFSNRNQYLAAKLLKQGYRYHKIRKAFSTFYRIHLELIVNNIGLKTSATGSGATMFRSRYFMVI